MRPIRRLLVLLSLLLPQIAQAQESVPLAKLVAVQSGDTALTRQFFGHVVARETVELAFQVGGQITEFPVIEGEPVPKDGLIAQLDLEPFELALEQARVQKDQADRTLERLSSLQGSTVSQVKVDDAQTQADLAAISVKDAERSLKNATLVAPFDALVAARNVANYSSIGAGTPVVRLHDMSELRVEIDVPEVLFQRAGRDPDVDLWAVFPTSEKQYPLSVREFNAETSQVGQTFRITLGMSVPDELVVLPGSSVTVFATIRGEAAPISIPGSSLIALNDGSPAVMVFSPSGADEGTVTAVTLEIKPGSNGEVRVISGLENGQEIVASGASRLNDGDRIKRFTGFSN